MIVLINRRRASHKYLRRVKPVNDRSKFDFEAYSIKSRLIRNIVLALIPVVGGLSLMIWGLTTQSYWPTEVRVFATIIGLVPCIFLIYLNGAVRSLITTGPRTKVDAEGLYHQLWSDQIIPWNNIERVWEVASPGAHILCIDLIDIRISPPRSNFGPRYRRSTRGLSKLYGMPGFGDLIIATNDTNGKFDDLRVAVQLHVNEQKNRIDDQKSRRFPVRPKIGV